MESWQQELCKFTVYKRIATVRARLSQQHPEWGVDTIEVKTYEEILDYYDEAIQQIREANDTLEVKYQALKRLTYELDELNNPIQKILNSSFSNE